MRDKNGIKITWQAPEGVESVDVKAVAVKDE